jgi:hypothetical protein
MNGKLMTRRRGEKTIYLISCVRKKCAAPTMAKDLYTSSWFKKARLFAEATGCPWFILSAKHGLLSPDRVVAPYEKTLTTLPVAERFIPRRGVPGGRMTWCCCCVRRSAPT